MAPVLALCHLGVITATGSPVLLEYPGIGRHACSSLTLWLISKGLAVLRLLPPAAEGGKVSLELIGKQTVVSRCGAPHAAELGRNGLKVITGQLIWL